jgi:Coenzyme PQQ synthesis protein D (PqqD)
VAVTIANESRVVVSKDQVACDTGDSDSTIVTWRNDVYYGLDPVGKRVWQLLQEPTTVAQIRDVLKAEYDVEPAQLESDIRELLEQLAEQGLVEITR